MASPGPLFSIVTWSSTASSPDAAGATVSLCARPRSAGSDGASAGVALTIASEDSAVSCLPSVGAMNIAWAAFLISCSAARLSSTRTSKLIWALSLAEPAAAIVPPCPAAAPLPRKNRTVLCAASYSPWSSPMRSVGVDGPAAALGIRNDPATYVVSGGILSVATKFVAASRPPLAKVTV